MKILPNLLSIRSSPILLPQTERAECGIACLGTIANRYGMRWTMGQLRTQFPTSIRGMALPAMIDVAGRMGLTARALRLEPEDLRSLQLPCVLHWNFGHYVLLQRMAKGRYFIFDPVRGECTLPFDEVSRSFTGVALEVFVGRDFAEKKKTAIKAQKVDWFRLMPGSIPLIAQILVVSATLELFVLISPLYTRLIVDQVMVTADRQLLLTLLAVFGLALVLQQGLTAMRAWMMTYLSCTAGLQWKGDLIAHMFKVPLTFFLKRAVGDVQTRLSAIDSIQSQLSTATLLGLLDGAMALVTLAAMIYFGGWLAAISLLAVLLYLIGRALRYPHLRARTQDMALAETQEYSIFLESLLGIKTIKLFRRESFRKMSWINAALDRTNAKASLQLATALHQIMNGSLIGVERLLVLAFGAILAIDGKITVGVLLAFVMYKEMFVTRLSSAIDKYFELKTLYVNLDRIADLVLTPKEGGDGDVPRLLERPAIELTGVRFRYGEYEPYILDGVDLRIEHGKSVAIVGASGCGKSTLFNLLGGVFVPTSGAISIGGISGTNSMLAWRDAISTVAQDDVLFSGSIEENICFFDGMPVASQIEECARAAAVHEEIMNMPMQYRTTVGDMGSALSGGQKQRILIARALYRRPKILLLDEATSHLDLENERLVNAAITALNITRITIAHRPQTIMSAKRLLRLSNGMLEDVTGTYAEAQAVNLAENLASQ